MPLTGTTLTKLAADEMRLATGCQIAMTYSGRIGGQGFRKGDVTLRDFYKAFPFSNILVTTQMSGAEIRENVNIGMRTLHVDGASPLTVSGLRLIVDPAKPAGLRVTEVCLEDGTPLQPEGQYGVVLEDYLAENPFGFRFPRAERLTYHNLTMRDLMLQRLREMKIIKEDRPSNVILKESGN